MSVRLLAFLSRGSRAGLWLLIGTAREEYLPDVPWLGKGLSEIRQHPGLVEIGSDRSRAAIRSWAVRRHDRRTGLAPQGSKSMCGSVSEGNPFVALQQYASSTSPRLGPVAARQLPTAVRISLAELGRLSDRSRQLVGLASVVGREFDFSYCSASPSWGILRRRGR